MSGKQRRIAVVAVFISIFVFLSLPLGVSRAVRGGVTEFFSPVFSLARSVCDKFRDIWRATFHSENVIRDNVVKERRILELRAKLALARAKIEELKSFHSQLEEIAESAFRVMPARVIARETDSWYQSFLIDRGTKDGVKMRMAVAHGRNLVGRVVEVGRKWSRVRLILDPASAIPAVTNDSGVTGLVVGAGPGELKMTYIEPHASLQVGDAVLTEHLGQVLSEEEAPLPKGLFIGTIASVSDKEEGFYRSAKLESPVDFRDLSEVFVVIPE